MVLLRRMPNTASKLCKDIKCTKLIICKCAWRILDFGVNNLTHNVMTRFSSDIERRSLYMTLFRKSPFIVFGNEL